VSDKECPKCHSHDIEIIVLHFDNDVGMVRCKVCFNKLRLKDYYYWKEHDRISRGGRV